MTRLEAIEKYKAQAQYEKEHRTEILIQRLVEMKPFTDYHIPAPPMTDRETYKKHVIPNFIRCGAIPSDKLIKGKRYYGSCRNASEAVWLGDRFEYIRTKWGMQYPEKINNFDNDDGHDLFVPIRQLD